MAIAYVKGGMPVEVEGHAYEDFVGVGYHGHIETFVEVEAVCWYNTGKPVSANFEASLSSDDWDAITAAIAAEAGYGW